MLRDPAIERPNGLQAKIAGAVRTTPAYMAPPRAVQAQHSQFSAHVLLVEDNSVNQEICTAMLQALGCKPEIADDGRAGVEAVFGRSSRSPPMPWTAIANAASPPGAEARIGSVNNAAAQINHVEAQLKAAEQALQFELKAAVG